jgi:sporulation protein YlmC with PRC-barrel domain
MKSILTGLLACGLVAGWTAAASAVDPRPTTKVAVPKTYKASKLIGSEVRNMQNEKLGKIEDFVLDMDNGTVNYVALASGGVLGAGEKLFAIPFNEVQMRLDGDSIYFLVNVSKEKIKNSKGFDKDNWPVTATPGFADQIDHNAATPRPNTPR